MGYKMEKIGKNFKKSFIIFLIVWLLLTILLVAPIAFSIKDISLHGGNLIEKFIQELTSLTSIFKVLNADYIETFIKTEIFFTCAFAIVVIIGLVKASPKNEYTDIEHGSSDWSENGEQYKILSKNKGIILAQKNYLPVDKRGNVNVLVVGRFRFW